MVTKVGMKARLRRAVQALTGSQRWNSDEDQKRLIPNAKTIFDVGANVGQTAKTYRKLFPQADIYSFEPFPLTYYEMTNAVKGPKFYPVNVALSDTIGEATLNIGGISQTNSMLHRATETGRSVQIQTDTIDRFCTHRSISTLDILKIDVEGAEEKVLKGAEGMFGRGAVGAVFTEVYFDPVYEGMPLMWDLHAQLQSYGFRLHGLYSLSSSDNGRLNFGNALYTLQH
jgi:FkbM family methyltransferase